MFNPEKKREFLGPVLVKDVIAELEKEDPDAIFTLNGEEGFYIHVESDDSTVAFDNEALWDEYPDADL